MANLLVGEKVFQTKKKQVIRSKVKSLVKEIQPRTSITLPCLNFEVEKELLKYGSVIGVERNKTIHQKQKKIREKYTALRNLHLFNGLASNILQKRDFEFAWLDFCGSYSRELHACVQNFNGDNLIITICYTREHKYYTRAISADRDAFYYKYLLDSGFYPYKVFKYKSGVYNMAVWFTNKEQSICEFYEIE